MWDAVVTVTDLIRDSHGCILCTLLTLNSKFWLTSEYALYAAHAFSYFGTLSRIEVAHLGFGYLSLVGNITLESNLGKS